MGLDAILEDAFARLGIDRGMSVEHAIRLENIDVWVFRQTWGSTALGHGGIGGQTITSALTTVVAKDAHGRDGVAMVYFGGGFAYTCKTTEEFSKAVRAMKMPPKWELAKLRRDIVGTSGPERYE